MGLTKAIGGFITTVDAERVPASAVPIVTTGFTDCVAVLLAGLAEPVTRTVASTVQSPIDLSAVARFAAGKAYAPDLALIYGTAAHALDYDDTGLAGHPSAVLVPTILAQAQEVDAGGAAMIAAYVAGYEVWADLIRRDADQHHGKGWHPSAVFGAVAAAAAAGVLRRLSEDQARQAVGIAASLAGGVVANFGSMTKPFHLGRAAQSGLLAARLAAAGMTAAPDTIEHDLGFLRAISPRGKVNTADDGQLGNDWRILRNGVNIKLYPMCYAIHRALDAMIDLRAAHGFSAADVGEVRVELGENQAAILRNHRPQSGLDAKFSAEFAMAAAATVGRCTRAELDDSFVLRPDIQSFLGKVGLSTIAERDIDEPAHSPYDRVHVALRDGRTVTSEPVSHPRGHFKRSINAKALREKFQDCATGIVDSTAADRMFDTLQNLSRLTSVRALAF